METKFYKRARDSLFKRNRGNSPETYNRNYNNKK